MGGILSYGYPLSYPASGGYPLPRVRLYPRGFSAAARRYCRISAISADVAAAGIIGNFLHTYARNEKAFQAARRIICRRHSFRKYGTVYFQARKLIYINSSPLEMI